MSVTTQSVYNRRFKEFKLSPFLFLPQSYQFSNSFVGLAEGLVDLYKQTNRGIYYSARVQYILIGLSSVVLQCTILRQGYILYPLGGLGLTLNSTAQYRTALNSTPILPYCTELYLAFSWYRHIIGQELFLVQSSLQEQLFLKKFPAPVALEIVLPQLQELLLIQPCHRYDCCYGYI